MTKSEFINKLISVVDSKIKKEVTEHPYIKSIDEHNQVVKCHNVINGVSQYWIRERDVFLVELVHDNGIYTLNNIMFGSVILGININIAVVSETIINGKVTKATSKIATYNEHDFTATCYEYDMLSKRIVHKVTMSAQEYLNYIKLF